MLFPGFAAGADEGVSLGAAGGVGVVAGAHPAAPVPQRIDLSAAHSSVTKSPHVVNTATTATGKAPAALTATGAVGAKGGASALALACTLGFAAVLGVGFVVNANDRTDPSPAVASSSVSTPDLSYGTLPADDTVPTEDPSPTVDPVCATVIPDLSSETQQFNTDAAVASAAVDSYNSAMASYNSGETAAVPDDSTVLSDVDAVIGDLDSMESTLRAAVSQAQDSSVESDLDAMLTATQQMQSLYQSYANDPTGSAFDTSSQVTTMNSASDSLQNDCGA